MRAASKGDAGVVKLLLDAGAQIGGSIDIGDQSWRMTTSVAVQAIEHPAVIALLLARGLSPNEVVAGVPLLLQAAARGHIATIAHLIKAGADIKGRDSEGHQVLAYALMRRDLARVEALLAAGADLEADGQQGEGVLALAACEDRIDLLAILFKRLGPPDARRLAYLLQRAAGSRAEVSLVYLLAAGADINAPAADGGKPELRRVGNWVAGDDWIPRTALGAAIGGPMSEADEAEELAFIKGLVAKGARVDDGEAYLARAIYKPALFDYLLAQGAKVDARDSDGMTALFGVLTRFAGDVDSIRQVRQLLLKGADPNLATLDQVSPLMQAAQYAEPEVIAMLFTRGARLEERDREGNTALAYAAYFNHATAIGQLLSYKADLLTVNDRGLTPLMRAAATNEPASVELLLAQGAPAWARDHEGKTALDYATPMTEISSFYGQSPYNTGADGDEKRAIRQLLLSKAKDARDLAGSPSLLRESEYGTAALVARQLELGVDPNQSDAAGQTPLMLAARRGDVGLVKALLAKGASPAARTLHGLSVLHYAVESGKPETLGLLLAAGADPEAATPGGWTPLMEAAERGQTAIAQQLLAKGAKAAARTRQGDSVLLAAARGGQPKLAELLLAKGGSLKDRDGLGASALHLAAGAGKREMLTWLLKHGLDPKLKDQAGRLAADYARQSGYPELAALLK